MRLEWDRPGVIRITARVEEVAALVAGGRIAAKALDGIPGERGAELQRVLSDFDRATKALRAATPA